ALYFFGAVDEVHAVLDVPREQGETFGVITLRFASGARGVIEVNQHGPLRMFEDEIEIVGTEAALRLPGLESKLNQRGCYLEFSAQAGHTVAIEEEDWARTVHKCVW